VNLPARLRSFARGIAARALGQQQLQPPQLQQPQLVQLAQLAQPQAPAASLAEFAVRWRLGEASVQLLQTLPEETLRIVVSEFHPAGDTVNVDGRLQGFVRAILTAPKRPVAVAPLILPAGKRLRA